MMKTPLAERPIFHHLEHRVETHIFLCVLAYHFLVAIETALLNQGVHSTWATIRQILSTHQVATIVLPTDRGKVLPFRKGMAPEPRHLETVPPAQCTPGDDAPNQHLELTALAVT